MPLFQNNLQGTELSSAVFQRIRIRSLLPLQQLPKSHPRQWADSFSYYLHNNFRLLRNPIQRQLVDFSTATSFQAEMNDPPTGVGGIHRICADEGIGWNE